MRIAYIILAHRMLEQLARLINVLARPQDTVFVHLDRRADRRLGAGAWQSLLGRIERDIDVRPVRRHACYWGNIGIVEATMEGIRAVVDSGVRYDRAILLSGQDYPIKPRSVIDDFLISRPAQEFIEAFSFERHNRWSDFGYPHNDVSRAWYWHWHVRGRWLHVPIRRRFPLGMVPHGGSQWWVLTPACLEYLHRFVTDHPDYVRYFKHAYIPDEQFFQTILANSPFAARLSGADLTFVDSSRPAPPWPATLDMSYLPALMDSGKLLARKFDHRQDPQILDAIDQYLLGRPSAHPGARSSGRANARARDPARPLRAAQDGAASGARARAGHASLRGGP